LYDLDTPDETVSLDLKDAEPKEIIVECYKQWLNGHFQALVHLNPLPLDDAYVEVPEYLYESACRILKPFKDRIYGTFNAKDLPEELPEDVHTYAPSIHRDMALGTFLGALLNVTRIKEVEMKAHLYDSSMWIEDFMDNNIKLRNTMINGCVEKRFYYKK